MKLNKTIAGIFNLIKQPYLDWKEEKALSKDITRAIEAQDEAAVAEIWAQSGAKVKKKAFDKLLLQAIETDNVGIFNTLLGDKGPNYTISSSFTIAPSWSGSAEESYGGYWRPALIAAIDMCSEKIALHLAKNPAINIDDGGSSYTGGSANRQHLRPLDEARLMGLSEVAEQLLQRAAERMAAKSQERTQAQTFTQ